MDFLWDPGPRAASSLPPMWSGEGPGCSGGKEAARSGVGGAESAPGLREAAASMSQLPTVVIRDEDQVDELPVVGRIWKLLLFFFK